MRADERLVRIAVLGAVKRTSVRHVGPNVRHERQAADSEAGCGLSARWRG